MKLNYQQIQKYKINFLDFLQNYYYKGLIKQYAPDLKFIKGIMLAVNFSCMFDLDVRP